MKCKDCKFWHIAEPQFVYGMCHRYPPQPDFSVSIKPNAYGNGGDATVSRRADPIHPNTHESDWCGEHQPNEATK